MAEGEQRVIVDNGSITASKAMMELAESTEQDYNYAKSSARLIAIVNESLNHLSHETDRGRSQVKVGEISLRAKQNGLQERGSTVFGLDLISNRSSDKSNKISPLEQLEKSGNINFKRKKSQETGEYSFKNPQINDNRTVNSSSQHDSYVVRENPDLMPVVKRRKRSIIKGQYTIPCPITFQNSLNLNQKNQQAQMTTFFSPKSVNIHQLATLQHSKEKFANATKSFPRRKVKRNMLHQPYKSDRFHEQEPQYQMQQNISPQEVSLTKSDGSPTGSQGSPFLPTHLEWITTGLNSSAHVEHQQNSEVAEKIQSLPKSLALTTQIAVKQTFLDFKKRAQRRDSPLKEQSVGRNALLYYKKSLDAQSRVNQPKSQAMQQRPKLKQVMLNVDPTVTTASQKSCDTRVFNNLNLVEMEGQSAQGNRSRLQTQQQRQRVVISAYEQTRLDQRVQKGKEDQAKNELFVKTQTSDLNLKKGQSNGSIFNRLISRKQTHQHGLERRMNSTGKYQQQDDRGSNSLAKQQKESIDMATSDIRKVTKDSIKITGKLESGDDGNSTFQISAHKSSIHQNVRKDANKHDDCMDSPKLSIHSLNNHSKPFEVTITKIPAQEMENDTNSPNSVSRRCSVPFKHVQLIEDPQVVTTQIHELHQRGISNSPPNSIESGDAQTIQTVPDEVLYKGKKVLWSPKSSNRLAKRDTWLRQGETIRLEQAGLVQDAKIGPGDDLLPSIHKLQQTRSVYTTDRQRMQKIFANTYRTPQIIDPQCLNELDRKHLPVDKSFQVHQNQMLPSSIKPKALAKNQAENLTAGQMAFLQNTSISHEQRTYSMLSQRLQPPIDILDIQQNTSKVITKIKPWMAAQNAAPQTPIQSTARSNRANNLYQKSGQVVHKSQSRPRQRKQISPTSRNNMSFALATKEQQAMESQSINYGNLAEPFHRAGSRMQRQLEELEIMKGENSVLDRAELPDVISTVKESITRGSDPYRDLILRKHQQVLSKRVVSRKETYRAKQRQANAHKSPLTININQKLMNGMPGNVNDTTSKLHTQTSIMGETSLLNDSILINERSVSPALNINRAFKRTSHHRQSPVELDSPRAKQRQKLMVNMPKTPLQEYPKRLNSMAESILIQQPGTNSRGAISGTPAPDGNTHIATDQSEGKSSHYKNPAARSRNICVKTHNVSIRKEIDTSRSPHSRVHNEDTKFRVPRLNGFEKHNKPCLSYRKSDLHSQEPEITMGQRLSVKQQETIPLEFYQIPTPFDQKRDNELKMGLIPSQLSGTQPNHDFITMPAPLLSARNNLLESSKASSTRSPTHHLTQDSIENSIQQDKLFQNREVMQSLDTDRNDLVNCLQGEMSQADQQNSKVLTRLLKGQDPAIQSEAETFALDLQEVGFIKKTQLESKVNLKHHSLCGGTENVKKKINLLFHLNTLYSTQSRAWQKYDEQWALFELDHVKTAAPIPSSPQFLLVHLIQQLKNKSQQLKVEAQKMDSISSSKSSKIVITPVSQVNVEAKCNLAQKKFALALLGLAGATKQDDLIPDRKQQQESLSKKSKEEANMAIEYGADQVSLKILDEAFRMSKVRLQMAQTSVLYKYNDDDRRIFVQFKSQLKETYDKIKISSSCTQ